MASRLAASLGSLLFLVVAPGTVLGLLPWTITGGRFGPPLFGLPPSSRALGAVLVAAGVAFLLDCFRRFALEGLGTPLPLLPPSVFVATGAYRHVRNPMYVALVATLLGEALLLGQPALLRYALGVWAVFFAAVVLYEEPALAAKFGESYRRYREHVPRWLPRLRPWRG